MPTFFIHLLKKLQKLSIWPVWLAITGCFFIVFLLINLNTGLLKQAGFNQQQIISFFSIGIGIILLGLGLTFNKNWRIWVETQINVWKSNLDSPKSALYAILSALLISIIIYIILLLIFNRRYDYVDDIGNRDYVRNDIALLFSANVWRQVLSTFYKYISASIPWYGISLYFGQFLAVTITVYLLLTRKIPLLFKFVFASVLIFMYIQFFIRASYNYASLFNGGIAVIAFFDMVVNKKRLNPLQALLWGCFLALSFIYRRDGIKAVYLFVLIPVFAFLFVNWIANWRSMRTFLSFVVCIIAFAIPTILIQIFDEYQYNTQFSDGEQLHRISNRSRAPYYGHKDVLDAMLDSPRLLKANGWSVNDILMAEYQMFLFDENKFAADRFWNIFNPDVGIPIDKRDQGLQSIFKNLMTFGQLDNFVWFNRGWIYWNEHWEYWPFYMFMITGSIFFLVRGKTLINRLFPVAYLVYVYFLSIYMLNYMRLPRHIAVPPLMLFCIALIICGDANYKINTSTWYKKVFVFLLSIFCITSILGSIENILWFNSEIPIKNEKLNALYTDLETRLGKDSFIFIRPIQYLEYYIDPLTDQGPEMNFGVLGLSSGAYSPLFYKLLEKYGLDYGYQLLPWMIDNPKAYFINNDIILLRRVQQFILDTYSIQVEMQSVYVYPDGLTIYRIISKNKFSPSFRDYYQFIDNIDQMTIFQGDETGIHKSQFKINGIARNVLFEHPPASVGYKVFVPQGSYFKFDTALSSEVWDLVENKGDGVKFEVLIDDGVNEQVVFSQYIDPKNNLGDRKWHNHLVDLRKWAGQIITITLITDSGPNQNNLYDWAGWGDPRIVQLSYFSFVQKFYLGSPSPEKISKLNTRRFSINNSFRDVIYAHPPGQISYPVTIRPNTWFHFGIGLDPQVWYEDKGDGVIFEVKISSEGKEELLYSQTIDPKNNLQDRKWLFANLDLSKYENKNVIITFTTHYNHDERFDWAFWIDPYLYETIYIPSATEQKEEKIDGSIMDIQNGLPLSSEPKKINRSFIKVFLK